MYAIRSYYELDGKHREGGSPSYRDNAIPRGTSEEKQHLRMRNRGAAVWLQRQRGINRHDQRRRCDRPIAIAQRPEQGQHKRRHRQDRCQEQGPIKTRITSYNVCYTKLLRVGMTAQAIVAEGIQKSFGGIKALRGINFSADTGTIHAIVGENGAGKSTLMKILSGIS